MTSTEGDKLLLKGLMFYGYHGVRSEEKKLGQKFIIDIDAWMDLRAPGQSDNMFDTVSYTDIYRLPGCQLMMWHVDVTQFDDMTLTRLARIAKHVVEGPSQNLLESVAQLIATTTLNNHSQINAIRVTVKKPHVAVPGPLDFLGVEITRYRTIDMPL